MTTTDTLELPFLHLNFHKDLQVLFCRWRKHVNLRQFAEGYMAALRVAAQERTRFWLHDLRLRNSPGSAERSWLARTFVPSIGTVMGGGSFIAYLMSPLQREAMEQAEGRGTVPSCLPGTLTTGFFTNEHDALEWLNTSRIRQEIG